METTRDKSKSNDWALPASILFSAVILAIAWNYGGVIKNQKGGLVNLESAVLPTEGVILPAKWGDLGSQMAQAGVIDAEKFESTYRDRGGITEETRALLYAKDNGNIRITPQNSGVILNLLWALGLGNKNEILERGPMATEGETGNFASTGGWTLAKGNPMDHYSKHKFITLTPQQQALVERVSKNIYRPCCGNSTHFPDCNHGMAMLALLELMSSEGVSEEEMYRVALQVNAYWFPDTYLTIGQYLDNKGIAWSKADPKEILGADYSSAGGYRRILSEVQPVQYGSGGGCGA